MTWLAFIIGLLLGALIMGSVWIVNLALGRIELPQPRDRKGRFIKLPDRERM